MGRVFEAYFPETNDPLIDSMTNGHFWDLQGTNTITFSISDGFAGETWADPASVREFFKNTLEVISIYTDVKFNFVGYFNDPAEANQAYRMHQALFEK